MTLFGPEVRGNWAVGLPDPIARRAEAAATAKLFGMPRYDRTIGSPEEDRGVEFWGSRNAWHDYCGGMGVTMTADDVAVAGARRYMTDVLGANYFRFEEELRAIGVDVAARYNEAYPPTPIDKATEPSW
jgi:hypothetical protein